jgi:predicted acylesterase/phospholipase RssA
MGERPEVGTALVLSGGGARGAYQAGVLAGFLELGGIELDRACFGTIVGSSAGSINAGMLFDPEFCGRLIEMSRRDILAAREQVEDFFDR